MDRLDSRGLRTALLLLAILALAFSAYLLLDRRPADPDMFWHIATGRWIVEHRAVPTTDPFSWWAAPRQQPWVAQEWLFGLAIYGVYRLGGFTAVYWTAALMQGLLALLAYALMRARRVTGPWALLLTCVVTLGTLGWTTPRPQTVSFVLVLLVMLLLEHERWPAALAVVLLGVNIHGGLWPVYVLVFAFYEFPRRWWLVLAAAGVTLVNPNPVGVLLYPAMVYASPTAPYILEWGPTALWTRKGDLLAYVATVLAVQRRRVPLRDAAMALAFAILGLTAYRHLVWFYVLVIPVLAPCLARAGEDLSSVRLPERVVAWAARRRVQGTPDPGADTKPTPTRALDIVLLGALVCAVLVVGATAVARRPQVSRGYPQPELLAFLKRSGAQRIFNVWGEGGYLIFNGLRPMIDGRFDPYLASGPGKQDLAWEYTELDSLGRDPVPFMSRMRIDFVLARRGRLTEALLRDPAFVEVAADARHIVFRYDALSAGAPQTKPAP